MATRQINQMLAAEVLGWDGRAQLTSPAAGILAVDGLPVPRVLFSNVTPVGNVGAGEDDLMVDTIPGGTFAKNGDCVVVSGEWDTAEGGGPVIAYVNGTLVGFPGDSVGNLTDDFQGYPFEYKIVRISSNSIRVMWPPHPKMIDGEMGNATVTTIGSLDFGDPIAVKTTGEGRSGLDDEIIQRWHQAILYPAP